MFCCFFHFHSSGEIYYDYGYYKLGKPYTSNYKLYTPKEPSSLIEKGVSSWYGKEFAYKKTANGAIFNPKMRTAAHRTLPMPSAVLIRNLENGTQTVAIVNDRGPFKNPEERIIDVSQQVAEDLGFVQKGKALVEIEYLPLLSEKLKNGEDIDINKYIEKYATLHRPQPNISIPQQQSTNIAKTYNDNRKTLSHIPLLHQYNQSFYTQIGVFSQLDNAQTLYNKLANSIPNIEMRRTQKNQSDYYIIRSGPFKNEHTAQNTKNLIQTQCKDCHPIIVLR